MSKHRFEEAASALLSALPVSRDVGCALSRAKEALGIHGLLTEVALDLGFTPSEAWGIMSGWDRAEGTLGTFWASSPQHDDHPAVQLGRLCYRMCHE